MHTTSAPDSAAPLHIAQELSALDHGYLLIEPSTSAYAPFLRTLDAHACVPRELAHRAELMPQLIDLAQQDAATQADLLELWQEELDAGRPPLAGAWIDSRASVEDLAAALARHLIMTQGGQRLFWRYYDPRVLSLTLTVLTPAQRQALLAPVKLWQFPWAGHRWALVGDDQSQAELDMQDPIAPDPAQWARIERSAIATQVLLHLQPFTEDAARQLPARLDQLFADTLAQHPDSSPEDLIDVALQHQKELK